MSDVISMSPKSVNPFTSKWLFIYDVIIWHIKERVKYTIAIFPLLSSYATYMLPMTQVDDSMAFNAFKLMTSFMNNRM